MRRELNAISPTLTERPRRDLAWVVALVFLLFWAGFAHTRAYSANEHSRLAAIEALVERGVWAIDDSRFGTIDKIRVGEHYYSSNEAHEHLAISRMFSDNT